MSDMTVATTIANQLGGTGKLKAMIGAKYFVGDNNSLAFRFTAKSKNKSNLINIKLTSLDLYDVTFYKYRNGQTKIVEEANGLYCDMLKTYIEKALELKLSL